MHSAGAIKDMSPEQLLGVVRECVTLVIIPKCGNQGSEK